MMPVAELSNLHQEDSSYENPSDLLANSFNNICVQHPLVKKDQAFYYECCKMYIKHIDLQKKVTLENI
jgi:hypothetical protein